MGRTLEFWRIPAATILSLALIGGTYALVKDARAPARVAASPESALLQAIASKDSDADGLADWEEVLYGTDPKVVDTRNLGMSDGEAVSRGLIVPKAVAEVPTVPSSPPGQNQTDDSLPPASAPDTITAEFSKQFFALYLNIKQQKNGENLSEEEMQMIATKALEGIAEALGSARDFKAEKDLKVGNRGAEAMKRFAAEAEAVLRANGSAEDKSELLYLKDAIERGDTAALASIARIAKAYRTTAVGIAALEVPPELIAADLALINAMVQISRISEDFMRVNTDPLVTMLALQQYPKAVLALGNSFIELYKAYRAAGVILPDGTPGAGFVNIMPEIAEEQEAAGVTP